MWARARIDFLFTKGNCINQRHHCIRHLRTQCTNLHPRGHWRRDALEESQDAGVLRVNHVAGVSKANSVPHKDTRSIDNMDPVVLKYTNMINEMRKKSSGVERIHETHFGSIRFDEENTPHHEFFGQESGGEANIPSTHHTPVTLHHDTDQSEVEAASGLSVSDVSDEKIMNDRATQHGNYIDDCIFGDSPSMSRNLKSLPVEHLQSKSDMGREVGGNGNDNLSYIDEVFFKNSLENLEINRQPTTDYSDIKEDLEKAVLSGEKHFTNEASEEEILDHITKRNVQQIRSNDEYKTKKQLDKNENSEAPKSAYEYVVRARQEERKKQHSLTQESGDGSNKSYKKILSLVNGKTKSKYTRYEVLKSLKSSILFNNHDIVGLHKPYGIAMHGGSNSQHHILTEYLPELAEHLQTEALYPVHRLDATTTGVVLLARTPAMADTLKRMFKERQLKKTYWTITKNIPNPMQGIIDIPIAEGIVDGRRRMVLKPDVKGIKSTSSSSKLAITRFRVISKRESAALIELSPMTGVKHQLRVHLAFGINCPVLGDHKYSHLKKMAPQALSGDMLDKLKMKQSKVRDLPLFLHCKSIVVPEIVDGRNISIHSKIPAFFNKTLSLLKLNRYESQVKLDELPPSLL